MRQKARSAAGSVWAGCFGTTTGRHRQIGGLAVIRETVRRARPPTGVALLVPWEAMRLPAIPSCRTSVRLDIRLETKARRSDRVLGPYAFGFSRVALYQAMAAFRKEGLPGLLSRRRGPKAANKLTDAVLEFIDRQRAADSSLRAPELAAMIREHLGLSVHPRSIERALARRAKKGRHTEPS